MAGRRDHALQDPALIRASVGVCEARVAVSGYGAPSANGNASRKHTTHATDAVASRMCAHGCVTIRDRDAVYGKGSCKSYLLLRRDGPTAFERVSLPSLDAARDTRPPLHTNHRRPARRAGKVDQMSRGLCLPASTHLIFTSGFGLLWLQMVAAAGWWPAAASPACRRGGKRPCGRCRARETAAQPH